MQELADTLGIHVSTVSRALKNKYLQCSSGIYPLNYFLSSKLKTQVGGYISSKTIISCIEQIIKEEIKPLSDEQIADYLKRQGIQVARRTVAKYRSQLGLPCTHIRKQK
jgi:RNA polymerase sigma-54 factor